ncbi:MAG: hypothetical protein QOF43_1035 [Gaiellaceae bacterium]|nr:hypothetical protein [Gaiellaceae bacterium]
MRLLVALPLLGVARLLPEHGFGLWLRLAASTLLLLAPGRLVARALGLGSAAATFTTSVALVAGALAVTFAVHAPLVLALVLVLVCGAAAMPFQKRVPSEGLRAPGSIALAGIALGIALWSVEGLVRGDALFHLGRIRKLDDFGGLSLRAVDEFKDGGLHPGYAFPLWHGWLALISKVGGVDPAAVVLHESSILAPLAVVLAFEMGRQVFRSRSLAFATLLAQVGMIALAPGGGGSYTTLDLPGTAARQLLVPAAIALFFGYLREPSRAGAVVLGAAGLDLAFVHPTYALFLAIPLVGFALVRAAASGADVRASSGALAALGIPVVLVFLWLLPLVRETRSHDPSADEKARAIGQYARDLVVGSPTSYHLSPALPGRTGAIAIAALALVPLAALAARRRWSAFVLGGTVLVLAVELLSPLFTHFSDLVSISQSRRAAGFVPFAFAFAGGVAVLTRALRLVVLPVALAAGIVLQLEFPGDFELRLAHGGPALVTWVALWGGLAGIVIAVVLARRGLGAYERPGVLAGLAATLFVIPVAVHGFANWDADPRQDGYALTPGLVQFLQTRVPKRAVVYADLETSYRIAAYAPVYVANAPPTHVADTAANRPYPRRDDLRAFLQTGNLAIARRYGAGWLVLRRGERVRPAGRLVYRDERFRVYRL